MDAETAALLFPQGYQTTDDLENDLTLIRFKLDSARNAKQSRLIPQLVKLLEKREKLLRQIQCKICDHLLTLILIYLDPLLLNHINLNSTDVSIKALRADPTISLLDSWGFDSIDSLRNAITKSVTDLEVATAEGHTGIVEEETEKLSYMRDLLCDVLSTSSNNHQRKTASQNKVSQVEEPTSLSFICAQL